MNLERHFVNRIRQQAKTRQNATALRHKINGLWKDISWNAFQQQLDQLSLAFLACNIQVQDKIAIFAHNMSRWTIADIAALQVRAITVPIYSNQYCTTGRIYFKSCGCQNSVCWRSRTI